MSTIDVSDIVTSFNTQGYSLTRTGPGSYVRGSWIDGATTTTERFGNVQVATGRDLTVLPENMRSSNAILLISSGPNDSFLSAEVRDQQTADTIHWSGRNYRVIQVDPWAANGYWRAIAVEILQ
jgi:hypothetical protein